MLTRLAIALLLALPATASAEPHFRIVRGAPIADESVPFMASLVESGYSAYDGHFCGGSVITPTVVLTAAHCVEGETARSIAVVTGRSQLSDETAGTRSRVDAIAVDPRYDDDGNDAALVHLTTPAAVAPIGLSDDPAPFGLAAVAGWGITTSSHPHAISDELRAVQIPVVANRSCRRRFGRDFSATTMLCAGGDGRDSCNGDSGGPLVGADGREIGIVSFGGRRCGAARVPAVYTRVAAELPWIGGVLSRWG